MALDDVPVEDYRRDLLEATRNFRSQLIVLEREHLQAYADAVMRSRLAYIRYLDHLIRTLAHTRIPTTDPIFSVVRRLFNDEMRNADRSDEINIRRHSVYVSLRDIVETMNNGCDSDNEQVYSFQTGSQ